MLHACSAVAVLLVVLSQPALRASSIKEMITRVSEDERETAVQANCPPWLIHKESQCICHSLSGIAECCSEFRHPCYPNTSVMIFPCSCMTVDMVTNITYAGHCPYTCFHLAIWNVDPEALNNGTCSLWNRAGLLCEDCQEGYGLPLFSYDLHCVECSSQDLVRNVLLIVLYFFSLTLFCLLVIVCRISAARPPFSTFVLVSQIYIAPFQLQGMSKERYAAAWEVFEIFYGFWNLDIFRPLYHSLCLTPRMSNLQATILQYSIGFYPLLLLALILALVRLRDSGCRGIVWICRPIHWCLARFRKKFNIHSSLTDAFSTFIILSYIKIGYTSFYIFVPTRVYQPDGSYDWYSYAEPSREYLRGQHLLFCFAAFACALVFCILPFTILFLYPFKCFQKCLNCCGLRCLTLHAFADAFQGCYKDGTDGSRDYRWFAGVHLFIRFGIVLLFSLLKNYFLFSLYVSFISFALVATTALLQPYKKDINNKIDTLLVFGMGVFYFGLSLIATKPTMTLSSITATVYVMISIGSIPPLVLPFVYCFIKCCSFRYRYRESLVSYI